MQEVTKRASVRALAAAGRSEDPVLRRAYLLEKYGTLVLLLNHLRACDDEQVWTSDRACALLVR